MDLCKPLVENSMSWQRLTTPPITEAALDLRFGEAPGDVLSKLDEISQHLRQEYSTVNEVYQFNLGARIEHGNDPRFNSKKSVDGYRLLSQNRSFVVQLRTAGVTISKLAPYSSWEELRDEAIKVVELIKQVFPILQFTRIALRYINNFNQVFQGPINYYLNILPAFSNNLPQSIDGFAIRLLLPKKEENLKSIVKVSIESTLNSDTVFKVVFDIDVYKEAKYDIKDIQLIFSDFELIRNFKNEIFFHGLTPDTLKNFN